MKGRLTDKTLVSQNPRRLAKRDLQLVEAIVDDWSENEVVRKSTSEYATPIIIIGKKDGEIRIFIDFTKINPKAIREHFPVPLIEDTLDRLAKEKVQITLDMNDGFFLVSVEESSRKILSLVIPTGQYEFCKIPQGFCTSPFVFLRFLYSIFADLIRKKKIITYFDDFVIVASSKDEAINILEEVLQIAADYALNINGKKCQLLKTKIEFLDHIVESGTINPSMRKTEAVANYPEPNTTKKVQRFLAGYFRKFVKDYAQIAKPISDLLKKDATFMMDKEQHTKK